METILKLKKLRKINRFNEVDNSFQTYFSIFYLYFHFLFINTFSLLLFLMSKIFNALESHHRKKKLIFAYYEMEFQSRNFFRNISIRNLFKLFLL